ncbi:hypothetical protein ACFO9Q_00705 [Paenibacillus sp. GCM10023252]|uniref:hypothetical protein n=1 Tax=Paenibacillus sp. GCM10023252 TaxID=3252649 RepID=UPI0036124C7D
MLYNSRLKPVKRSPARQKLGKLWFTGKRYLQWIRSRRKMAKTREYADLPYLIHTHQTPLMRQLRNVDMELQRNNESEHNIRSNPWGGYTRSNRICRRIWNEAGECIEDQLVTSNQALMMYSPLLEQAQYE